MNELQKQIPGIYYFPSYEIVMDELRDYRFYSEDMLHISPFAVEYIWEKFCNSYISDKAIPFMKRMDKLNKFLQHRPFNATSEAYITQQNQARREMADLEKEIQKFFRK